MGRPAAKKGDQIKMLLDLRGKKCSLTWFINMEEIAAVKLKRKMDVNHGIKFAVSVMHPGYELELI